MAVSADCRISLSVAGQLRGSTRLTGRNWGLVKFCDGEMMGKKLKLKLTQQVQQGSGGNKNVRRHVSMSLTADVVGELKVSNLNTHQSVCFSSWYIQSYKYAKYNIFE